MYPIAAYARVLPPLRLRAGVMADHGSPSDKNSAFMLDKLLEDLRRWVVRLEM